MVTFWWVISRHSTDFFFFYRINIECMCLSVEFFYVGRASQPTMDALFTFVDSFSVSLCLYVHDSTLMWCRYAFFPPCFNPLWPSLRLSIVKTPCWSLNTLAREAINRPSPRWTPSPSAARGSTRCFRYSLKGVEGRRKVQNVHHSSHLFLLARLSSSGPGQLVCAAGGLHRWSGRAPGGSAAALQRVLFTSTHEDSLRGYLCRQV